MTIAGDDADVTVVVRCGRAVVGAPVVGTGVVTGVVVVVVVVVDDVDPVGFIDTVVGGIDGALLSFVAMNRTAPRPSVTAAAVAARTRSEGAMAKGSGLA